MGTQTFDRTNGLNQAVIYGQLVAEPERRELPSGSEAVSFSLTVRSPGEKTTSVPLVWYDPPAIMSTWSPGDMVAALGPVVRRFYQGGGGLGSSTEVVIEAAERIGPRTKKMVPGKKALATLQGFLEHFAVGPNR